MDTLVSEPLILNIVFFFNQLSWAGKRLFYKLLQFSSSRLYIFSFGKGDHSCQSCVHKTRDKNLPKMIHVLDPSQPLLKIFQHSSSNIINKTNSNFLLLGFNSFFAFKLFKTHCEFTVNTEWIQTSSYLYFVEFIIKSLFVTYTCWELLWEVGHSSRDPPPITFGCFKSRHINNGTSWGEAGLPSCLASCRSFCLT